MSRKLKIHSLSLCSFISFRFISRHEAEKKKGGERIFMIGCQDLLPSSPSSSQDEDELHLHLCLFHHESLFSCLSVSFIFLWLKFLSFWLPHFLCFFFFCISFSCFCLTIIIYCPSSSPSSSSSSYIHLMEKTFLTSCDFFFPREFLLLMLFSREESLSWSALLNY